MSAAVGKIVEGVDGALLMDHCVEFARRVKLSGTPEELESFRYLQRCLDSYGCRTELLEHDAYISLPGAARVEAMGRTLRSITHSFSLSSPPGGLKATLVDLGDGAEADFAREDCGGKIVLVDGIASPAVTARAKAAGAAGQLHVSHHQHLHEMCISPVWGNPSSDTVGQLPTTVACTISDSDGAALRKALAETPFLEITLHAKVDSGWRKTPLLVAHIEPDGAEDAPFVLLSGHHDTWYYGVMDNGSANATMLEAVRILEAEKSRLRRGVRICFWSGHSHGRYSGSTWYADLNRRELDRRCAAHVNVDSTGGVGATIVSDNGVVAPLAGLAREATLAESGQRHLGKRPTRSSDQSFWGIGIPSIYGAVSYQSSGQEKMRHALGWWWHTPEDLLDKIDRDFLVRDTRIVLHTLWRLATDPILPLDPVEELQSLKSEISAMPGRGAADITGSLLVAVDAAIGKVGAFRAAAIKTAKPDLAVDDALMRMCRALVPLDYSQGDRFQHDPALPSHPWPVLQPIRELAALDPASDAAKFAHVGAMRAHNRVLAALDEIHQALASAPE